MNALLKLSGLTVERGGRSLVQGFDMVVQPGRITVIMGPNGAGKSSLLLAMAGMLPVTGGIALGGQPLSTCRRQQIAEKIAWQGELPPTEFGLSVVQRLGLAAGEADEQVVAKAAAGMEVDGLLGRSLGELSSGERQRVELAALMLRDVPLWLLDEPTAHLDLRHQIVCLGMLKKQAASGRAIIVVLHDIQQAMAIADDAVLFGSDGEAEVGEAAEILSRERLQKLFQVRLQSGTLLPDYGGEP